MAKVSLNPFGRFNIRADGSGAGGAQVLPGKCSQKRVDIAATAAFNNASVQLTVDGKTDYLQIVTDGPVKVWVGSSTESAANKQDYAFVAGAGTYTFDVETGDSVYVWTA